MYMPLLSPVLAICPVHFILLHFITRRIMDEEYRSLSSWLCTFLHSPVQNKVMLFNNYCLWPDETSRWRCISQAKVITIKIIQPYSTWYCSLHTWSQLQRNMVPPAVDRKVWWSDVISLWWSGFSFQLSVFYLHCKVLKFAIRIFNIHSLYLTYLLTYSLHGAESFLSS